MTRPMIATTIATTASASNDALLRAVAERDTAAVRHEMILRADVDVTNDYGNTALMLASAYGYDDMLVDGGADVNATGRIGNAALIVATQNGHSSVVRHLLAAGCAVDATNDFGTSTRSLAAGYGHREITALLDEVPVEVALNEPLLAF